MTIICSKCKEHREETEYYKRKDGKVGHCKPCDKARLQAYKATDKAKEIGKIAARKYRYGITDKEYKALLIEQNNTCAICPHVFEDTKMGRPHIDHDHATNKVRQLLCHQCNVGLGAFRDNAEYLIKAAQYITQHKGV